MRKLAMAHTFLLWTVPLFASQPDPKSLLRDAAAHYRNARSFRIEFETKITSSTPFSNSWSKQRYLVARADQKYHYEADGSGGQRIRINDGESDWFYRPLTHQYSVQRPGGGELRSAARGTAGGTTEAWINAGIHSLLDLDEDAEGSVMQHDEALRIGQSKFHCFVIRTVREMSFREGTNSVHSSTYWIEESSGLVRKAVLVNRGPTSLEDDEAEKMRTVEIIYRRVDLDRAPDLSLFHFQPPAGAYMVEDSRVPISQPVAIGSTAPGLKLRDRDGGSFDLAELKGKVVLVDFWTSWCGACLEEMKAIAQLPQSYSARGLVIVSLDEDEEPERGDNLFFSQQFHWRNLHDIGEIQRRNWGVSAFPMLILVDRGGKIAWTSTGISASFSETLRSQLEKPELLLGARQGTEH